MNVGGLITVAPSLVPKFDPDKFLQETANKPFDADAFLHEMQVHEAAKGMTPVRSALRGVGQGATMGWADEMAGAADALPALLTMNPTGPAYTKGRDEARLLNEAAHRANSKTYTTGEIAGGLPYSLLKNAPLLNMAIGATQGAGYNSDPRRLLGDMSLGASGGAIGGEAARAVGKGASALRVAATRRGTQAAERAAQQATDEVTHEVGQLSSSYGGEAQKGHRYVENIRRLEQSLTPEQKAVYDQVKQTGAIDRLEHQLADSTLSSIPGQAEKIAEKKAAFEAAQSALPQTIAARTQELSKPSLLKDAVSLTKSYGEPLIANAIGGPAAGLMFGRTRMGKAIMNRVTRPGNQIALYKTLEAMAALPGSPGGELARNALMRTPVPLLLSE